MPDELKPCPFCGLKQSTGMPRVRVAFDTWTPACEPKAPFFIYCERCEARGPEAKTEKQAAAAWNKRKQGGAS